MVTLKSELRQLYASSKIPSTAALLDVALLLLPSQHLRHLVCQCKWDPCNIQQSLRNKFVLVFDCCSRSWLQASTTAALLLLPLLDLLHPSNKYFGQCIGTCTGNEGFTWVEGNIKYAFIFNLKLSNLTISFFVIRGLWDL